MRLFTAGDFSEIVAIMLFALYVAVLPDTQRDILIMAGAALLAAFLTWRREKTKRKNVEAMKKLEVEIERLDVDVRFKAKLLNAIDDLYSEVRRTGFVVKVVGLDDPVPPQKLELVGGRP